MSVRLFPRGTSASHCEYCREEEGEEEEEMWVNWFILDFFKIKVGG